MVKIADIIKYEGDNSTFIWKHPCEDFNTTTQLIVHESQEAILFLNGQLRIMLRQFFMKGFLLVGKATLLSIPWTKREMLQRGL